MFDHWFFLSPCTIDRQYAAAAEFGLCDRTGIEPTKINPLIPQGFLLKQLEKKPREPAKQV